MGWGALLLALLVVTYMIHVSVLMGACRRANTHIHTNGIPTPNKT